MKLKNNEWKFITVSCIIFICSLPILVFAKNILFPIAVEQNGKNNKKIASMEIIVDEKLIEYIELYPYAEYTAGVKVVYDDMSQDILDPSSVKWISSNDKVLIAKENGALKPTGIGQATITVEYEEFKAEKTISVKEGKIVSMNCEPQQIFLVHNSKKNLPYQRASILLNATNGISFDISESSNLKATIGDNLIAKYENGIVFPKSIGASKINYYYDKFSTEASIIVVDEKSLNIIPENKEIFVPLGETTTLSIFAESDGVKFDITKLVSWSVSDDKIIEAVDGFVTGINEGNAVILVSFAEKTEKIAVTVKKVEKNTAITLFP